MHPIPATPVECRWIRPNLEISERESMLRDGIGNLLGDAGISEIEAESHIETFRQRMDELADRMTLQPADLGAVIGWMNTVGIADMTSNHELTWEALTSGTPGKFAVWKLVRGSTNIAPSEECAVVAIAGIANGGTELEPVTSRWIDFCFGAALHHGATFHR